MREHLLSGSLYAGAMLAIGLAAFNIAILSTRLTVCSRDNACFGLSFISETLVLVCYGITLSIIMKRDLHKLKIAGIVLAALWVIRTTLDGVSLATADYQLLANEMKLRTGNPDYPAEEYRRSSLLAWAMQSAYEAGFTAFYVTGLFYYRNVLLKKFTETIDT